MRTTDETTPPTEPHPSAPSESNNIREPRFPDPFRDPDERPGTGNEPVPEPKQKG